MAYRAAPASCTAALPRSGCRSKSCGATASQQGMGAGSSSPTATRDALLEDIAAHSQSGRGGVGPIHSRTGGRSASRRGRSVNTSQPSPPRSWWSFQLLRDGSGRSPSGTTFANRRAMTAMRSADNRSSRAFTTRPFSRCRSRYSSNRRGNL